MSVLAAYHYTSRSALYQTSETNDRAEFCPWNQTYFQYVDYPKRHKERREVFSQRGSFCCTLRIMKKRLIIAVLVLALFVAARFVPIYQRIGYLDKGPASLCIGYTVPTVYARHVILNGLTAPSYFKPDSRAANVSGLGYAEHCAEPVKIRYFLI